MQVCFECSGADRRGRRPSKGDQQGACARIPAPRTQHAATIDRYLDAYGDTDETSRRTKVAETFSDEATFADPPFEATGVDEITASFGAVLSQFPGHTFARTSDVDVHHAAGRYTWQLTGTHGEIAVAGMDFVRFAEDGRLDSVVGFFGEVPPVDSGSPETRA